MTTMANKLEHIGGRITNILICIILVLSYSENITCSELKQSVTLPQISFYPIHTFEQQYSPGINWGFGDYVRVGEGYEIHQGIDIQSISKQLQDNPGSVDFGPTAVALGIGCLLYSDYDKESEEGFMYFIPMNCISSDNCTEFVLDDNYKDRYTFLYSHIMYIKSIFEYNNIPADQNYMCYNSDVSSLDTNGSIADVEAIKAQSVPPHLHFQACNCSINGSYCFFNGDKNSMTPTRRDYFNAGSVNPLAYFSSSNYKDPANASPKIMEIELTLDESQNGSIDESLGIPMLTGKIDILAEAYDYLGSEWIPEPYFSQNYTNYFYFPSFDMKYTTNKYFYSSNIYQMYYIIHGADESVDEAIQSGGYLLDQGIYDIYDEYMYVRDKIYELFDGNWGGGLPSTFPRVKYILTNSTKDDDDNGPSNPPPLTLIGDTVNIKKENCWDTTQSPDGKYKILIYVKDASGKVDTKYYPSTVIVNNKPNIPNPPVIEVDRTSDRTANIYWAPPKTNDDGTDILPGELKEYRIYRSTQTGNYPNEPIGHVNHPGVTYVDDELSPGEAYYYSVTAVNKDGNESIKPIGKQTPTQITPKIFIGEGWNLLGISQAYTKTIQDEEVQIGVDMAFNGMETYRIETSETHTLYSMWNQTTGYEPQYYGQCRIDDPNPGMAYWIYNPPDALEKTISVIGKAISKDKNYAISLDKGWNMAASPYTSEPLPKDKIYINDAKLSPSLTSGPFRYENGSYVLHAADWNPWEGYFLKSGVDGAVLKLKGCDSCGDVTPLTFSRKCKGPAPPPQQVPRPVARMSATDDIARNKITGSIGNIFDLQLYVDSAGFSGASFKVDYDETMLTPCVRDADYPDDPEKCRIIQPGGEVPLNPSTQLVLSATVGDSIRIDLANLSQVQTGRVSLGTITFKVLGDKLDPDPTKSPAYGKTSPIEIVADDPNLVVFGEVGGSLVKYDVESVPALFVEEHYNDYSPPVVEITDTPMHIFINPDSPDPSKNKVVIKYKFKDDKSPAGDVTIDIKKIEPVEPTD